MEAIELKIPGTDDFFTQEAYKVLRTNLQFCGQDVRVVAITSCDENEGKTTVSLHLAKSLAELGKKVLVIDADMRKSVMAGRTFSRIRSIVVSPFLFSFSLIGVPFHYNKSAPFVNLFPFHLSKNMVYLKEIKLRRMLL